MPSATRAALPVQVQVQEQSPQKNSLSNHCEKLDAKSSPQMQKSPQKNSLSNHRLDAKSSPQMASEGDIVTFLAWESGFLEVVLVEEVVRVGATRSPGSCVCSSESWLVGSASACLCANLCPQHTSFARGARVHSPCSLPLLALLWLLPAALGSELL